MLCFYIYLQKLRIRQCYCKLLSPSYLTPNCILHMSVAPSLNIFKKEKMTETFFMKIYSPPVRTLHRLGSPSQPILSYNPSQEKGRTGESWGNSSPGNQALHWGQGQTKAGRGDQPVWEPLPVSPKEDTTRGCPVTEPALSLAARPPPEEDAPRVLIAGTDCWECVFFAKRRGRKSTFDAV